MNPLFLLSNSSSSSSGSSSSSRRRSSEANSPLINEEIAQELQLRQLGTSATASIAVLDAIALSRKRLASNARDLLVLESLCTTMILRQDVAA